MKEIRKLAKSFGYAFDGLKFCIKSERNLRIHLVIMAYVLFFALTQDVKTYEVLALLICFGMVISAELLNTAIEVLCDKESTGYNYFIKRAKDIAAAAVFVTAVMSIFVGILIFKFYISSIFNMLFMGFLPYILAILALPLCILFIFKGEK